MSTYPKDAYYCGKLARRAAEARGDDIVIITPKKKATIYNGGFFLDIFWNIMGPKHNAKGYFTVTNLPVTRGAADKTDPDDARVKAKTDKYLSFSTADMGDFGPFIVAASKAATKKLQALKDAGQVYSAKVKPLVRTHYSMKNPDPTLKGKEFEHPVCDVQFDWGTHSPKHFDKSLAGKPKMYIYDATKPVLNAEGEQVKDDSGNPVYEQATVEVDGVEQNVDQMNAHLFITANSVLERADIHADSCFANDNQVSIPIRFASILVRRNKPGARVRVEADDDLGEFDAPPNVKGVPLPEDD